jgi:serine/threonine protein kinase
MGKQSHADARVQQELGLPDRYEVLRHVASGGMASVWCANDQALGRNVAIKLLAERFAAEEDANGRFTREARAAARLSGHPHVVMIYDVGETAGPSEVGGRAFIVMEYLAGGTVADAIRVDAVRRVEAVKWLHEAASALDYGHSRGVLHRDIKPANMLLDRDRVLHVADFGIARLGTEDTITSTGQVLGTAAYLAPERALGRPATGASDRYSLAVAAFELLVGERPFTSRHFTAQARQHVEDQPPAASNRNRSLPREVDAVLARGMAKRPEDRWATAQEFAQAVEDALTGAATKTLRVAPGAPPRRPRSARAAAVAAAGSAAEPTTSRRIGPRTAGIPARTASSQPRTGSIPPRTGSIPAGSGSPPRRLGRRVPALVALLAGAGVAVAVAGTLGSGGSTPARSAAGAQRPATAASAPKRPAATTTTHTAPPPAATTTSTTTATTTGPPTATQLEAQGHKLMQAGSYSAAVPVLRQAVQAAGPGTLTYAYALYDLGRSLRLAGDPRDAVPVLWQRMQIHNQTGAVREQLQLALIALGQASNNSGGVGSSPSGQSQHGPRAPGPGAGSPVSPAPAAPGQGNDQGD